MDTPARLLRVLALLTTRGSWQAGELAERLEITERTVRRDVTRLRDLGYPIEATTGPYGGYALGAGGRLPPLVLDDDEAVAVAIALRDLSGIAAPIVGDAALSALTKLGQILPPLLRERVAALGSVTVGLPRADGFVPRDPAPLDVATLVTIAVACRRQERVRFTYRSGSSATASRLVEPHRLVAHGHKWYLVAFDNERRDWRTFRLDRIDEVSNTGARFVHDDPPDAAAMVAEGIAIRVYDSHVRVRLHLPAARVPRVIAPTVGVIDPEESDATTTVVRIGGEPRWIAHYLASLECGFDVLDSDDVRRELLTLGERLVREHAGVGQT
jgi:predicted DNA-binding transcriptional regulator YafY